MSSWSGGYLPNVTGAERAIWVDSSSSNEWCNQWHAIAAKFANIMNLEYCGFSDWDQTISFLKKPYAGGTRRVFYMDEIMLIIKLAENQKE